MRVPAADRSAASRPLRVLVAGGGVAAAEAVLALRAYAGDRVDIELVSAASRLHLRPAATVSPFTEQPVQSFSLAALASDAGAAFVRDRVEAVAPDAHGVRLASGGQRRYDALVLAIGARARAAIPGALTFRDQRDAAQLQRVLDELRAGRLESVAVTVPLGVSWSLPAYELALLLAAEVERLQTRTTVAVVTPERAPVEVFGAPVSAFVSGLLADRDVAVHGGAAPRTVDRRGLRLADGGTVPAQRVVALPALVGQRIPGVPPDFSGFVPTEPPGRVAGVRDVYAAGDMTSFPVKQGGVAAQQADAVAAHLARVAGADVAEPRSTTTLRTQLFGAPRPAFLEAVIDADGRPVGGWSRIHSEAPWRPSGTLVGRRVTAWMADQALTAV
jgi:sulfide:quinone oxidoreductase